MNAIKAELEAAPSLKSFEYQAWDEPTREFVNSVIKMYLNPGDAMEKVLNETPTTPVKTEVAGSNDTNSAKKEEKTPTAAGGDDLESFLNDLEI